MITYQQLKVLETDPQYKATAIQEHVGWHWNAVLTGLHFSFRGDVWVATIKANFPSGPKYTQLFVERFPHLCEAVEEFARKGLFIWDHDRHPPKIAKRRPLLPSSR